LWRLDPGADRAVAITKPRGSLDGLAVLDDDSIVFTDWGTHGIYIMEPGQEPRLLAQGFGGPADFGLARQGRGYRLALPDLARGELHIFDLLP
jgi:hypothetical protein